jgi:hypothetical protein
VYRDPWEEPHALGVFTESRRWFLRHLLLACTLLGLTACSEISGGTIIPPGQEPIGTWDLTTVTGQQLPVEVADTGDEVSEVLSAILILAGSDTSTTTGSAFGEKELQITRIGEDPTTVTETRNGVWVQVGTNIAIEWDGSCPEAFSLAQNLLAGTDCEFDAPVIYERRSS